MEGLKTLMKDLTFILLLASVLELLLPNKSMRGFVQLVMGLFVIAAVLTPIADFIKVKLPNEIPAFADNAVSDIPVIAAGGENKNTAESAVNEQYKRILAGQVKVLCEENGDIVNMIEISLENDYDRTAYPRLEKIVIQLGGKSSESSNILNSDKISLKEKVAQFLQIPEDIIEIN